METIKTSWLGVIAVYYIAILSHISASGRSNELVKLKALQKNLLDRLDFAFKARVHFRETGETLNYPNTRQKGPLSRDFSPEQELRLVLEAAKMFRLEFSSDKVKELTRICDNASKRGIIGADDLLTLQEFLLVLVKHSYTI